MKRGVWRARNLVLVRGNDPETVGQLSEEGFALLPDPRKPLARLTRLAGVGPATASAVLATVSPEVYPFFDELVADQIPASARSPSPRPTTRATPSACARARTN